MNLRYKGPVKHAIRLLSGDESATISDEEVLKFADNWEKVTGGDIDSFIDRNQVRIRWTKNYNGRNFFIGKVAFTREMYAIGYAISLHLNTSRFRELLQLSHALHSFRDKVYDFENRIIETTEELEELRAPVGWFKNLFSNNNWDIEQQEILLREHHEYLESHIEKIKGIEEAFDREVKEFLSSPVSVKDWKDSFF